MTNADKGILVVEAIAAFCVTEGNKKKYYDILFPLRHPLPPFLWRYLTPRFASIPEREIINRKHLIPSSEIEPTTVAFTTARFGYCI